MFLLLGIKDAETVVPLAATSCSYTSLIANVSIGRRARLVFQADNFEVAVPAARDNGSTPKHCRDSLFMRNLYLSALSTQDRGESGNWCCVPFLSPSEASQPALWMRFSLGGRPQTIPAARQI